MLKPEKQVQKLLISSTSRFVGEYESEKFLITHSWSPIKDLVSLQNGISENPYCRNYYMVVIKTEPTGEHEQIPDYLHKSELFCIYLAIIFGKRFDSHGPVEWEGFFNLPYLNNITPNNFPYIGFNNHIPRTDLSIELNLSKINCLAPLIDNVIKKEPQNTDFINTLNTAGKFYLRSIRIFEQEPELAFLDLITCGEVLAAFYENSFSEDELYDTELKKVLCLLKESNIKGWEFITKFIKKRLYQVRRKYTLTILKLLNEHFFEKTESKQQYWCLQKDNIKDRLLAAYDLRSQYVHTGIRFGQTLYPHAQLMNETPTFNNNKSKFEKCLSKSPTYIGMERIMRYCLIRFIHLNGIFIDENLND